jgi:ABC-type transporter Mla subunit MlaD
MMKRASIVASPVLIGSVTVLITIVAVFLAYNANNGLPFVPTYALKAELPNAEKVVKGNSVRIGGFRVGAVTSMKPKTIVEHGKPVTVALIEMKLDKSTQPLPADTVVTVRDRSALGLKYIELVPGSSSRELKPGATIPVVNSRARVQI